MRNGLSRFGFPALLPLLLAACASMEMPPIESDPAVEALRGRVGEPLPFDVAVVPMILDEGSGAPEGLQPPPAGEEMVALLQKTKLFRRAVAWSGPEEPLPPQGTDVVLQLRAHRMHVRFEGRNALFVPNVVLWAMLVFPAWWVRDETFSVSVDLEAVLVSARTGHRLAAHTASSYVTRDLDDFQRGWLPLSILLAPGVFSSANWRAAGNLLFPEAMRGALLDIADWINGPFRREVEAGRIAPLHSTTFAFCAGLSKYRSLDLHNLPDPRDDAATFASFLADPDLGGLLPDRVVFLDDGQADAATLETALEAVLVKAPRREDTVLVYFAGYGTVFSTPEGPRHALLAYDSDPADPDAPHLSLDALASAISRSGAGRFCVIVDAGFAGGPAARGAAAPPAYEKDVRSAFREMAANRRGLILWVQRTGTGRDGRFVEALTAALAGGADGNADGAVTGAELVRHLEASASDHGYEIHAFGEDLGTLRLPFARGKVKTE